MLKEFKQFILRGNVLDLAVALVVGNAFTKIVSSFTKDVFTPPLGLLLGRVNFSHLGWTMMTGKDGVPVRIEYGMFLQSTFDFLIVAAAVFFVVKLANRLLAIGKKEEAAAAPNTRECPECLMAVPVMAKRCGHCTSVIAG